MSELKRKNIQITETQNQFLRRVSYETNIPEAEHIRRALDHYFIAWYGGNYKKEEPPVQTYPVPHIPGVTYIDERDDLFGEDNGFMPASVTLEPDGKGKLHSFTIVGNITGPDGETIVKENVTLKVDMYNDANLSIDDIERHGVEILFNIPWEELKKEKR